MTPVLPELGSELVQTSVGRMHARVFRHPRPESSSPLVLVHGYVVSSSYMVPAARWLARHHSVFAIDLPGFGKSDDPEHTLGIAELADAVIAWMDAAGLERAVLLGNSLGCQVVADTALRYPQRADRLVLVGPTTDPRHRSRTQQIGRLVIDAFLEKLSLWFVHMADWPSAGVRRSLHTFEHLMNDRIEKKLPHIRTPTLVVRGARDPIVSERWVEQSVALLPDARLRVIPGAAHAVNYDAPLELARVVRAFLRETAPASGRASRVEFA
jgi:2-hydroxy-6-oxonona-2,4-dienedioate hydrolase